MISFAALRRLEALQIRTNRRLAGAVSGDHRSTRYGSTLDFADFREYQPGDDVRRIDVHQLARHDVLRITLFEADDDLTVRILLDTSASMGMYDKGSAASDVIAALGAVALTSGDVVVLHTFPDPGPPRRFRGRAALPELIEVLAAVSWGGDTPFSPAADELLAASSPPGLTVIVSDLLTPDWHRTITRSPTRGSELLVVHVAAKQETDPDLEGDLALEDAESGTTVPVSLAPAELLGYRERRERWVDQIASRCREVGGRYLAVDADDDVEQSMLRAWRAAGVVR